MKKIIILVLISLMPLYGGMREMALSELKNTAAYIKQVAPRIRASGSLKANNILEKAIEEAKRAKLLFNHGNYQLAILYAREARELASFAVKIAIGRVKTQRGLFVCKNSIEYVQSLDYVKKHHQRELQEAFSSLKKARINYQKERYKAALVELTSCNAILKSIIGKTKMLPGADEAIVKAELQALRVKVKNTRDSEIKALYTRAVSELQKGNYAMSLLLIKSIEKRLVILKNSSELKVKEIEYRIKTARLSPKERQKALKLFALYKEALKRGNKKNMTKYLKEIQHILDKTE